MFSAVIFHRLNGDALPDFFGFDNQVNWIFLIVSKYFDQNFIGRYGGWCACIRRCRSGCLCVGWLGCGCIGWLGRLRGRVHRYGKRNIPLVVTYHPAYLLRTPLEKRKVWEDLQLAQAVYREQTSGTAGISR